MKRILLLFVLLVISISGWSQITLTHRFGVRANVPNASERVDKYVVDILGFDRVEGEPYTYTGYIPGLASDRKGNKKMLYGGNVTLKCTIEGASVEGTFTYPYIIEKVTTCDEKQSVVENHLQKADLSRSVMREIKHYTDDYMDHIRYYVNGLSESLPDSATDRLYMNMPYIVEADKVTYYSVIPSKNNLSASELYTIAERWYTYSYRSGKAVIEVRDRDNFIITGKGIYPDVDDEDDQKVDFPHIFSIQCRDGRARAIVSIGLIDWLDDDRDLHHISVLDYEPFGDKREKWCIDSIEEVEKLIADQFANLQKSFDEGLNAVDNKNDW